MVGILRGAASLALTGSLVAGDLKHSFTRVDGKDCGCDSSKKDKELITCIAEKIATLQCKQFSVLETVTYSAVTDVCGVSNGQVSGLSFQEGELLKVVSKFGLNSTMDSVAVAVRAAPEKSCKLTKITYGSTPYNATCILGGTSYITAADFPTTALGLTGVKSMVSDKALVSLDSPSYLQLTYEGTCNLAEPTDKNIPNFILTNVYSYPGGNGAPGLLAAGILSTALVTLL